MRICDRCEARPVTEIITKDRTQEKIDLCASCLEDFEAWRNAKPSKNAKASRPKREAAER